MNRRSLLLLTICLATGMACLSVYADQVYKWVDSEGHVHYSSAPPPGTGVQAQKVTVAAPQVVTLVTPTQPQMPRQSPQPRTGNSMDKTKTDAIDKQIRGTWGDFKKALGECQGIGQQLDDLRNGVSPNPVTHTSLTDAERTAHEQALEAQLKSDCPDGG